MGRGRPRRRISILIAAALAALVAAPTAAAWDPAVVLRSVPAGRLLTVSDIAGNGARALVGWEEDGATRRAFFRWSLDAGATWAARRLLDSGARRELEVDACGGRAWAASALRPPAAPSTEWHIVLDGLDFVGSSVESAELTHEGTARHPDIACAGTRRLAVAWFQKVGSGHRVRLFTRPLVPEPLGSAAEELSFGLGKGNPRRGLAVAATKERIYVAWFAGRQLKVKRYRVGAGPDFVVTPMPTRTLGELRFASQPELGAGGDRLVLAYTDRADLVARTSADRGATWGPILRLRDMPFPSEAAAGATNADVRGRRMLVSGIEITGLETPDGRGFLYRSRDGGTSWSFVAGSGRPGGKVVGGFVSAGGKARMMQAWDESLVFEAGMAPQKLRFRRQS